MSLPYTLKLFALCILIAAPLISAQVTPLHKDLYIDPTSTANPTGNIDGPFTTLSAAFEAAQSFINGNPSPQPLAISLLIKEDATLSNEQGQISLSLDGTNRDLSSVKLTTYGPPGSSVHKPAIIQISNAVPHIAMTIPEVKLIIENLIFQINIEQGLNQPEIILIDGKDSEVTFSHCAFKNSKVVDQNGDHSVFTLNAGRYLFKNCEFSQLDLSIPLITHQGSESSIIKYELNQFHDITVPSGSLIRANKAVTFDLISSKVQNTTGGILNVTETVNTILSDNTFIDTVGQYPISLKTIQKVIAGKNKISYAPNEHANHQGFLSLLNFDVLGISDTSVSEYFGLNSAISIASESTYQPAHTPMVILNGLTLNKNGLCVHDEQANSGLGLISVDLKQKAVISIENSQFTENTFYDMREHPTGRAQGASTFWIQAETSSLKIKKMTLENNKADRSLSNLYASVDDLNVAYSTFKSNTQLEGSEASQNIDSSVIFSNFGWFGQDLVFTEDWFKENYNDFGGAISIREADGLRVPRFVTVENCTFVDNRAKEGGAIYSNVAIQSFKRENNTFEGNQAPVDPDMSAILGKLDTSKPKLFLEVISQSQQSEKRSYLSGEFKLEDVTSGQDTGYSMEFYISNHKNTRMQSTNQYYASISIASTRAGEAYLVHNFTNKLTGPSVTLSSFTVVAPLGSMNAIQVMMRNTDDPNEVYTFEFQVNMKIGVLEPGRPRNCKRGEVYVEKQQACVKCPPGTYSLNPNALVCQLCITGADCSQGGDQIKALPGYWRDPVSDGFSVYACADESKCLGDTENRCAEGYAGPLCEACNTRDTEKGIYRPFLRNTCKSCSSKDIWEVVGDIVGLTAPIAILLYTLKTIVGPKATGASVKQFSWCLYTNIFINYLQNLFILGALDYVPLPYMFNYLINVIANPSFPIFGYLTCYFPSLVTSGKSYIGIFSLFASIPFMKILLVVLMAKLVARRGNAFNSSVLGLMWLGFLEAPGVLDFCLRFFSCKQVGNWVYSPFFLDIECDAANFELLRTIVLVPAVLIITVICPLAVTYSLSRGSLRSDEVEGQKTLRVMMLAKSADHIEKSHRSWLYFYIATFGKLGLLLLSTSDTSSFATFSVVMLYFGAMALLNTRRRILPFLGWRCTLLFVDMGMLLTSAVLGYGLEFVQGSIKSLLLTALWVGNAGYLLSVNLFSSSTKQGEDQYGKLQEGLPSSEEEESERGHKSEQLDQTV